MADKVKLTIRARLYLRCIEDWKSAPEVVALLGEVPSTPIKTVRSTLFAFVGMGLAEHHDGNDTFRISESGRAALAESSHD
jgi:hypothetical protein